MVHKINHEKEQCEKKPQLSIEERLANDRDGSYKKEVQARLDTLLMDAKTKLNEGTTPKEFAKLTKMITAIESAKEILNLI